MHAARVDPPAHPAHSPYRPVAVLQRFLALRQDLPERHPRAGFGVDIEQACGVVRCRSMVRRDDADEKPSASCCPFPAGANLESATGTDVVRLAVET